MARSLQLIERTTRAALKTAVDAALAIVSPVAEIPAVSRVVRGTATNGGLDGQSTIMGDLAISIGPGANAIQYVGFIVGAVDNAPNLALIPALSITDNLDGTFDVTLLPGAAGNTVLFTTDDPGLSFAQTVAGANTIAEVVTSEISGGVQVRITTDRTGADDAYESIVHYGQTLATIRP